MSDPTEAGVDSASRAHEVHSRETLDRLMPGVYDELRDAARRQLARSPSDNTLSTTSLVHEAYLKLTRQSQLSWRDRDHFMALSALAMRHVLVDRARARVTDKRGGAAQPVTLDEQLIPDEQQPETLLRIHDALERLASAEPRLARIVDCRFFGGFSEPEIAEALGVTVRTVQRDWVKARMLLHRALAP
jgi:RNA polymerase sigma factor (TIGR02999 family)